MDEALRMQLETRGSLVDRAREVLVRALNLRVGADEIDPDAALFGTGIGLDSVDALELVVALENEFGVKFPEAGLNASLRTLNSVADLVEALLTRGGPEAAS